MTSKLSSPKAIKRPQTVVACEACRKGRTKCSGTRPVCRKCEDRNLQCHYSADEDARPIVALKRKYLALSEAHAEQARELALLRLQHDVGLSAEPPEVYEQAVHHGPLMPPPVHHNLSGSRVSMPARSVSDSILPTSSTHQQAATGFSGDQASHILNALTFTSDEESLILLARLRMGEAWSTIVESITSKKPVVDFTVPQRDAHRMDKASPEPSPLIPDILSSRTHAVVAFGESKTNLSCDQHIASLGRTTSLIVAKPWLTEIFDRQYFKQVCYIYHTPRADMSAEIPGTQTSFGNLPFSSAIAANYHPTHVQEMQQHNFLVPIWAQRVLNGATIHADPFQDIMTDLQHDIANGIPIEDLCGSHPYISALDDAATFHRAPKLSQIAARTIASIKTPETSTTFTQYAMMYWFWALWKWLLCPTKETYSAIPEFAKPTTSQLFVEHPPIFDFVMPPGLRDMVCQNDTPNIQWFTEAAITIECHWDGGAEAALCRDGSTGEIDFNPICKSHIASLEHWTLGRSVRSFLPNIESFTKIQ